MKALLLIASMLCLPAAHARALKLFCEVHHNTELVFQSEVTLRPTQKNLKFGSYDQFDMFLSSLGNDRVELQLLDMVEPSRSYATGFLRKDSPELGLSIWKREYMLDVNCKLLN